VRKRKEQKNMEENRINDTQIEYTTYDRILRAWENSMEMVRDFEMYSKRIEDEKLKKIFKEFAEDEGKHASALRSILLVYNNKNH